MARLISPQSIILGASAVAVTNGATVTEDIFATINIPAGAMGLNGILRVFSLWSFTNSVNNKTCRLRLGGIGGTLYLSDIFTTTASFSDVRMIQNRGAANSQVGMKASAGVYVTSTANNTTSAIDTSAATTLVLTGQKALAGETLTLESYLVELILP